MTTKSKMTDKTLRELEKISGEKLTLGKLMASIRQADGMSQVEFSEKLKMSRQHLCDIEHDRKSVSPKLADKYSKILGYSKEQFIRLALQGLVDREGLNVEVEIFAKNDKNRERRISA